jgi:hypothetical protein
MAYQNITNSPNPSTWTSFTTTITGSSSNPTPGTGYSLTSNYLQVGKLLFINMNFSQTVAGIAGNGYYLFNIPSAFTINTSITGTFSSSSPYPIPCIGNCIISFGSSTYSVGSVAVYNSSNYMFLVGYSTSAAASFVGGFGSAYYNLGNVNVVYTTTVTVPIN